MIKGVAHRIKIDNEEYLTLENIRPRHKSKCCVCSKMPEKARMKWESWRNRRTFPARKIFCLEHGIDFLRQRISFFSEIEKKLIEISCKDYE